MKLFKITSKLILNFKLDNYLMKDLKQKIKNTKKHLKQFYKTENLHHEIQNKF
jgi:hypothetical protein